MSQNPRPILYTLFLLLIAGSTLSAQTDSVLILTPRDTVSLTEAPSVLRGDTLARESGFFRNFLRKENGLPQPRTSFILSMAIPGSGQIYNGKWWKVPFVYGAIGGLGILVNNNSRRYILYRTAFKRKQRDLPHFFSSVPRLDNADYLKSERDKYDKNRQLSYVGLVVVWLINGVEAFTDAHLMNFDVSDDLSVRLKPVSYQNALSGESYTGIGLTFNLSGSRP